MAGKVTRQPNNDRSRVTGWTPASAQRLRAAITKWGTQRSAAEKAGIARQSLVAILAEEDGSVPTNSTLDNLLRVIGATREQILYANEAGNAQAESDIIKLPALGVKAAAGDGSVLWGDELGEGPFSFAPDWLRREFGAVNSLRVVQIVGDSQIPDLSDGDWVVIDQQKNRKENGLAVIRLDDCLMIKRLHREGNFLQLISRNPIYAPNVLDLAKDEARIDVIGKAVYVLKRP